MRNYSTDNLSVNVEGRNITSWGTSDTPFTSDPIDPKVVLSRGMGGDAAKFVRKNPGRTITISVMHGSPDSAFLQGKYNTGETISLGYTVTSTLEGAIATEGVVTNDGQVARGGMSASDDVYTLEFNNYQATKGGE